MDTIKIKELINDASCVFITAHRDIDFDAFGSMLGMYYCVTTLGKKACLVIDDKEFSKEMKRAISEVKKDANVDINCYKEVQGMIDNNSLLIITDVNNKKRLQCDKLLIMKNKVVIDHHIKSINSIDCVYEYVDSLASSATEIVMDLINDLNVYIPPVVATIMLVGIYIDTNDFMLKTTEKTHACLSQLYKCGADSLEAKYLLKQNFNEYKKRQKLVLACEFYGNFAISSTNDIYSSVEIAKVCDTILTFNGVEACFVIANLDNDIVGISARSIGNINVEEVMAYFDGGGHRTDAAAQVKQGNVLDIKNKIIEIMGGLK